MGYRSGRFCSWFSTELYGGTHVGSTGEIEHFIYESWCSCRVRRIEALTGVGAMTYFQQQEGLIRQVAEH